jgi:hypothetical protein
MKLRKKVVLLAMCLTIGVITFAQTAGTLSVSIKTVTANGKYAPKHILAIWIEDSNGTFVKTRLFRSQNPQYRSYLTQFASATNYSYNTVDATTGATLQSHSTRTISWDATDVNGALVADGTYKVCIEFTEKNGSGPYQTYSFTKSSQGQTLTPTDVSNFQNVSISWTPTSSLSSVSENNSKLAVYPNPIQDYAVITLDKEVKDVYVTDVTGRVVANIPLNNMIEGNKLRWQPSKALTNGTYFVVTETSSIKKSTQVIINR